MTSIGIIRVYSEYDEAAIYAETGLSDEKLETYLGIYQISRSSKAERRRW
ncbi:MAG: hypothetical protein ACLRX9_02495 [Streptococcus salivarius]